MAQFTTTKTVEIACPACDSKGVVKVGKRDGQGPLHGHVLQADSRGHGRPI